MLTTSEHTQPHTVLHSSSTNTPPSVLSQGMTDTQRKILWKLLIELFLDRPQTIRSSGEEKEEKEQ